MSDALQTRSVDVAPSALDSPMDRMAQAKAAYTRAAKAALDGLPLAPAMVKVALEELNAARAALRDEHDQTSTPPPIDGSTCEPKGKGRPSQRSVDLAAHCRPGEPAR